MTSTQWKDRTPPTTGGAVETTCRADALLSIVAVAARPIAKPPGGRADAASSVLLSAWEDGRLACRGAGERVHLSSATDSQVAHTHRPGAVVVPGHLLRDVLRKLPGDARVTISSTDRGALLTSGRTEFKLPTVVRPEDYPALPAPDADAIRMPSVDLLRACDVVEHAMSDDASRYYLNGMHIHGGEGGDLVFVTTDGHRLSRFVWSAGDVRGFVPCIVPRESVPSIRTVVASAAAEEDIEISCDHGTIEFSTRRVAMRSTLVDGTFPDYARIIPPRETTCTVVKVQVGPLATSVERVRSVLNDRRGALVLRIPGDGSLEMAATRSDVPHGAVDVVEIGELDGRPDRTFGFNGSYLIDVLGSMPEDGVAVIRMGEDDQPTAWFLEGTEERMHLLMPVRV